jgi:YD repeat-containing protein
MKTNNRAIFLSGIMLLLLAASSFGQSSTTIKERKISSVTVQEYFIEEGMDKPVVESFKAFNEQGELIELKEFSREGEVKRWEKYTYDEKGRLVEEIFLDGKGKVDRKEKSIYKDGLRVEKQFFNNKDKLYKRKVYEYEYRD